VEQPLNVPIIIDECTMKKRKMSLFKEARLYVLALGAYCSGGYYLCVIFLNDPAIHRADLAFFFCSTTIYFAYVFICTYLKELDENLQSLKDSKPK
jgi:hypothetical protein